jgi:O-antigen/teichoic acid export membrane protein
LKKILEKIYKKTGVKSERTRNITKHVGLSFFYKGGSIIASFLLVPLTIDYLNTENYGIWLTLSSFIAWFSFFDIGLGNGLRNKFAEAKANGNSELAKGYVSSAYFTIGGVSILLIIIFILLNFSINWVKVFNTNITMQKDLKILMPIVFSFFCLQLIVKLITTIYTADQNHSMQGKVNFYTKAISLLAIWFLTKIAVGSLLIFGIVFSFFPFAILFFLNIYAFKNAYKKYRPEWRFMKKKYLSEIFGTGVSFFVIQIGWVIITTTDNFIISQLFSPSEVVPYNIAFKYFSIATMLFTIIVAPYWSTFTEAYVKYDFDWIKKSMNNLKKFVILFWGFCIVLFFSSNYLINLWVGNKVLIADELNIIICIYTCLYLYLLPLNYFINGIGKIRIQLLTAVIFAILNIPLSIFLAKYLQFGVNGVVFSTLICIIPNVILSTIQTNKIINQKAFGIWFK